MNKPQWITLGLAIFFVVVLFAATQKQFFGPPPINKKVTAQTATDHFSTDSVLFYAKKKLSPGQSTRINFLEHSISRGDVKDQQIHIYHQLARFWADSAKIFAPYAWYSGEAARLENSEKSLTFAAHLFLNNLKEEDNQDMRQWEAFQAKDLFERSLKLNANNDSSAVGLGAVYVFGGIAMPMEGIGMIKKISDKDPGNTYAQMTLGEASLMSGQLEKAVEHFKTVATLHPENLEAVIRVAETLEQMENKTGAVEWYQKSLSLIQIPELKKEVEARIAKLKK